MGESITRNTLRKELQAKGFTYRESRKIVSVVIDCFTAGLKSGELDLPFGKMTLVPPTTKRAYRLNKFVKLYSKSRVHFRRKD